MATTISPPRSLTAALMALLLDASAALPTVSPGRRVTGRSVTIRCRRVTEVPVTESLSLPLAEFLQRDASEFAAEFQSQLGGTPGGSLGAEEFDYLTPEVAILGTHLRVALRAKVVAATSGPNIQVCDAALRGSSELERLVEGAYAITSTNQLSSARGALVSDASIELRTRVLEWLPVPDEVLRRTGEVALDGLLAALLPQALKRSVADYSQWVAAHQVRGYQKGCAGSPQSAE